jgi:hypothetical protein
MLSGQFKRIGWLRRLLLFGVIGTVGKLEWDLSFVRQLMSWVWPLSWWNRLGIELFRWHNP